MRLIKKKKGMVLLYEVNNRGKWGPVAIHAEYGLGHDDETRASREPLPVMPQEIFEFVEVVMGVDPEGCPGLAGTIDQAGVTELIKNDHISFCEKCTKHPNCSGVSVGKAQGRLSALPFRDFLFKGVMRRKGA